MAHAPENTLEAFRLALRLGATGLESDAWLTADGVVVLHHDRSIGTFRKRAIASLRREQLPVPRPGPRRTSTTPAAPTTSWPST